MTIEAWIYLTQSTGSYPHVVSKWGPGDGSYFFRINGERQLHWLLRADGGNQEVVTWGYPRLELNTWYHVAVTYDGTNTMRTFINGDQKKTKDDARDAFNTTRRLFIGWAEQGADGGHFPGYIQHVRISNVERTSFPYAHVTNVPSVAAGNATLPPGSGSADLVLQSLSTYPVGGETFESGIIVQAIVENQGDAPTTNGFYNDFYADHLPTGGGDLNGSIRFLINDPVAAGATITLTTVITDVTSVGGLSAAALDPLSETSATLYAQADSEGVIAEPDDADNISSGVEVCIASPDAYEGDDTPADAQPVALGETQRHNFDSLGDEDWITFTVSGGVMYTIQTSDLDLAADTYLYLYDTDGSTLLAANDDYGGSLASQIEWSVPVAGTYYVLIKHWNPNTGGCGTGYTLSVEETPPGPLVYDSHTIDDDNSGQSSGNGNGIVNCGETIELYVELYNQGDNTATGVNAAISTSGPYVTWLYNTESTYPDIPGGGTSTNSNDFEFQVDPNTPDGHVIHFDLDISASNGGPWSDSFDVPVVCPNNPPNTPSNPSPADGATNRDINVDLSWTGGDPDPGDTVTYDVYFEVNDSTPDNLICDDASTPACDPGTLIYNSHYYWYVVATDSDSDSTTGDTWDFYTAAEPNNPPHQPGNPMPADEATSVSITADLSWTGGDPDPGDTVTYDVYFEANHSTPDNLICDDASPPACDPGTLAYDTHYYWYVVATDNHGASATGDTWDFTTESAPPTVGPLAYDSHTIDDDNSGQSSGNGDGIVNCGETIELYVDLDNQGGSAATGVNATISTSDHYVTWLYNTDSSYPDIPGEGTGTNSDDFDFQVDPRTPDGHVIHFDLTSMRPTVAPWSDSFDVPVVCPNNPPNTPSNPSPADGATNRDINVDLSWTGGDPDPGDTVTYDVYFEVNDSTPDNLICDDASTPACDPGTLDYSTHYYWYVVATDSDSDSTTGDTWDFYTGAEPNNPPYQPGNSMPADGATSVSITTDLSWTGGDPDPGDTVTYDVYFEVNDSTPDNLICDDAFTPACDPGTLAYDTHYYWYVVATDNHGASTTGDAWDFTTESAPPTVGPLVYDSHAIDDDNSGQSSGNGNGIINSGETIELYVNLYNQGGNTATGVNAAISTSAPYVTWLYNTESTYPDIPGGGTSTNSNDFEFQVDPNTPDGHVIHFDLNISASNGGPWSDSFDVPVACECFNLNTSVNPIGSGSITASPPPNCGGGQYTAGSQVQLTANSASGYNFSDWSGDASGSANPITVTMDSDKSVTANFIAAELPEFSIFLPTVARNYPGMAQVRFTLRNH